MSCIVRMLPCAHATLILSSRYVEREDEFDALTGAQLMDRDDALLGPHHLNGKVALDTDEIVIDLMTCDKDDMYVHAHDR